MPRQPVVVALRLLFSLTFLTLFSSALWAQEARYMAQLHAHTPQELASLLNRAEAWAQSSSAYPEHPIAIVLHGNEANVFIKNNYSKYQSLVDQAAKLDAFKVVDIKICETWMGFNEVQSNELPPFLDTVPFGPDEERRLIKAGYQSF